jgi:hypothetical protein
MAFGSLLDDSGKVTRVFDGTGQHWRRCTMPSASWRQNMGQGACRVGRVVISNLTQSGRVASGIQLGFKINLIPRRPAQASTNSTSKKISLVQFLEN